MIWLALVLLLFISFVFSGIEAGVLSVNRVRLEHRARQGEKAAIVLQQLLIHPARMLITVLVVTNFANIGALVIVTKSFVRAFGGLGYLWSLMIYLPVYLVGLELLPKSLFRRFPYRALVAFATPLRIASTLLMPVHFLGELVQRFLFGSQAADRPRMFLGREDFRYYAEQGEKTGALTRTEREMITNVVDFRSVVARDVMTPIDPARRIRGSAPVSEFLQKTGSLAHDRWLVTDDDGTVTGIVSAFEVLLERRRDVSVGVYQRRAVTVTPQEPAYNVLRKLRAARSMIAIVRGDGGAEPLGQITWEDLIRRLVAAAGQQQGKAAETAPNP